MRPSHSVLFVMAGLLLFDFWSVVTLLLYLLLHVFLIAVVSGIAVLASALTDSLLGRAWEGVWQPAVFVLALLGGPSIVLLFIVSATNADLLFYWWGLALPVSAVLFWFHRKKLEVAVLTVAFSAEAILVGWIVRTGVREIVEKWEYSRFVVGHEWVQFKLGWKSGGEVLVAASALALAVALGAFFAGAIKKAENRRGWMARQYPSWREAQAEKEELLRRLDNVRQWEASFSASVAKDPERHDD